MATFPRFRTLTIALGLLAAACGNAAQPSAAPTTPQPTPGVPVQAVGCPSSAGPGGPTLTGVSFGDSNHGLISGSDNFLWQTADGGQRWSVVLPPAKMIQLNGVHVTDASTTWVWGDAGLFSASNGTPWLIANTKLKGLLTAVAFTGAIPEVAVDSTGGIATSIDGITWTVAVAEGVLPPLHAVTVASPTLMVAVGDAGTIATSPDRGAHWVRQASGVTVALRGVSFVSASATTATATPTPTGSAAASAAAATPSPSAATTTANPTGYVVGDGTTLLSSGDGAATWKAHSLAPTTADLVSVLATSTGGLWAAGAGGTVFYSSDTGAHLGVSLVTDPTRLFAVTAVTDKHIFAVGQLTGIYESQDGGANWKRRNFCIG